MIHYHGTPTGGPRQDTIRFLSGRHALVPYPRPDDMPAVADVCQSFVLDNGAFSSWKRGEPLDRDGYYRWVEEWHRHPGFDWASIPDVIDGTPEQNDRWIEEWPGHLLGVPVWHLHEPLERLQWLCANATRRAGFWPCVALGSSGQWATPGTAGWWERMRDAMRAVAIEGRPVCKLHGLRMLNPEIFRRLPLASADSTNVVQNHGLPRFGMYRPPTQAQRMAVIAERIEHAEAAAVWVERESSEPLFIGG